MSAPWPGSDEYIDLRIKEAQERELNREHGPVRPPADGSEDVA